MLLLALLPIALWAQGLDPKKIVQWKFSVTPIGESTYTVHAEAQIEKPFHIFHTNAGGDGTLINTEFTFENADEAADDVWKSVPEPVVKKFDVIEGDVYWHEKKVVFSKNVSVEEGATAIKGEVYFQVCDDEKCLAPTEVPFTISLK